MSATAVLNQGHKARSETWRDAEGGKKKKKGEEKLKRVRRGREEGWGRVRHKSSNLKSLRAEKKQHGRLREKVAVRWVYPSECKALLTSHLNVEHQNPSAALFTLELHGRPRGKIYPRKGAVVSLQQPTECVCLYICIYLRRYMWESRRLWRFFKMEGGHVPCSLSNSCDENNVLEDKFLSVASFQPGSPPWATLWLWQILINMWTKIAKFTKKLTKRSFLCGLSCGKLHSVLCHFSCCPFVKDLHDWNLSQTCNWTGATKAVHSYFYYFD